MKTTSKTTCYITTPTNSSLIIGLTETPLVTEIAYCYFNWHGLYISFAVHFSPFYFWIVNYHYMSLCLSRVLYRSRRTVNQTHPCLRVLMFRTGFPTRDPHGHNSITTIFFDRGWEETESLSCFLTILTWVNLNSSSMITSLYYYLSYAWSEIA